MWASTCPTQVRSYMRGNPSCAATRVAAPYILRASWVAQPFANLFQAKGGSLSLRGLLLCFHLLSPSFHNLMHEALKQDAKGRKPTCGGGSASIHRGAF